LKYSHWHLSDIWLSLLYINHISLKFQCSFQTVQSHLQLCLEIFIYSNSRNLLKFLYRRMEENLKENHSLFPKKSIQKPQVWERWRPCTETSMKLNFYEFGFMILIYVSVSGPCGMALAFTRMETKVEQPVRNMLATGPCS
jgi:hypothetical protein